MTELRLQNGSRVCIVGGGPAGSFAALHLLKLAQERNLHLDILIFEPRDYSSALGARSCKGCAGILSANLVRSMEALGLTLPPEVIQSELRAYVVHIYGQVTTVEQPNPERRILSVYRGAGPNHPLGETTASFDGYLIGQACARGAQHIRSRARLVEWDDGPVVHTAHESYRADLLVLACGVNSRMPLSPAFGYQSPVTANMTQEEIARPDDWPEHKVAGFMGQPQGLVFGAVVPKGRYLNVSLFGKRPADETLRDFYAMQDQPLRRFFSDSPQSRCTCTPRIAVRPAPVYMGDRWVAVGDAAVTRLYKDGINSAFLTAGMAMRSALEYGIGKDDFERGYAPTCRDVAADNVYGRAMFGLSGPFMSHPLMSRAWVRCVENGAGREATRRVYAQLLWGMLTGDESYRELFKLLLRPRVLMGLGRQMLAAARNGAG